MIRFKLFLEAEEKKKAEEWHVLKTSEFHQDKKKKKKNVKEDVEDWVPDKDFLRGAFAGVGGGAPKKPEPRRKEYDGPNFKNPEGAGHHINDAIKHHIGINADEDHIGNLRGRLKAHYDYPTKKKTITGTRWSGEKYKYTEDQPSKEREALDRYSRTSSSLNSYLHNVHGKVFTKSEKENPFRTTKPHKGKQEQIRDLDKAVAKHAAPESFHVFTGIQSDPRHLDHPEEKHKTRGIKNPTLGKHGSDHWKVKLPSYTSTSINPQAAYGFTRGTTPEKEEFHGHMMNEHLLHIHIEKGSNHGAYIEHHSSYPEEREFVMRRGTRLHIDKTPTLHRRNTTLVHIWHAKVVGHDTALPTQTAKPKGLARLNSPTANKVED